MCHASFKKKQLRHRSGWASVISCLGSTEPTSDSCQEWVTLNGGFQTSCGKPRLGIKMGWSECEKVNKGLDHVQKASCSVPTMR